ncbi:MAG TPA: hypothetical protein VK623_04745 [Flavobacterium sp.]|nr:hypothetical protein [Flavobacterium sp.]
MNKIKYIFPAIAMLVFAGCDSDDDGFYNTKYIEAVNLMEVEPAASYTIGDVIYVDVNVPRLLDEPGQATQLDVVETTHAPTFDFFYILEKKNGAGGWELVDNTGNYVDGGPGYGSAGFYVQGFLEYDTVAETYVYRGGLNLTEAGDYRLNFSNTTKFPNKVALRSDSVDNNIQLNIFSTSPSIDASGMYNFTVTN